MKHQEALATGLNLDWMVAGSLPQENHDDLALALYNLLDNAIRASSLSSQGLLSLNLLIDQGVFYLSMSNSYHPQGAKAKGRGQVIARAIFEDYQGYLELFPGEETYRIEAIAYIKQ